MVVAMCCGLGCAQKKDITHGHLISEVTEVTLEEAADTIGRPISLPSYLPSNYKVQRMFIQVQESVGVTGTKFTRIKVTLLISDRNIKGKVKTDKDLDELKSKMFWPFGNPRMVIEETWETGPHLFLHSYPDWHKQIEINGIRGLLIKPSFWTHAVGWCLPGWNEPAFEILITSRVTTRAKTLIKIAESMTYVEE